MDSKDAWFRQHLRLTRKWSRALGRCDAEDLASEAVLRALRSPAPDGNHAPWTERIARNVRIDWARKRRRAVEAVALISEGAGPASPEDCLLANERHRLLRAALPNLPAPLREAISARYFREVTSSATVTDRTRTHRALARLRVALEGLRAWMPPMPVADWALGGATRASAMAMLPAILTVGLLGTATLRDRQVRPTNAVTEGFGREDRAAMSHVRSVVLSLPFAITPVPRAVLFAQSTAPKHPVRSDSATAVRRFDFDEDEVTGELQRPDGVSLSGDPVRPRQPSLIEIRREFQSELQKTLEEI